MKFTSMSGDVIVKLKGSLDANIDLSSSSGTWSLCQAVSALPSLDKPSRVVRHETVTMIVAPVPRGEKTL
jgi:hypothetical protein